MKIGIIGMGWVGSSAAISTLHTGIATAPVRITCCGADQHSTDTSALSPMRRCKSSR